MPLTALLAWPARHRLFLGTAGSLLLLLAWDASSLDLTMARWFGTAGGFPLESHWLWHGLLHDDIHWLPWLLELSLLGGFFVFRRVLPRTAARWLAGALVVGFIFGLAQQVRGAHYMSHTLWTAWLCWSTAAVLDATVSGWARFAQSRSRAPAPAPAL